MILSVVATPIGNLKDITVRAREVLEQATLVVAEDTRTTGQLYKLLGIAGEREFVSSHALSSDTALEKALERCGEHEYIALVTDAGTPTISDPGSFFVSQFHALYPDARIVPIPGASAVVSALSVSGFPADHFEFFGFIPHKKGRQTLFATLADTPHTLVLYDSPHRVVKNLKDIAMAIENRQVFIAREMTKVFEDYRWGTAEELARHYETHPDTCRGEFVIVIAPQ